MGQFIDDNQLQTALEGVLKVASGTLTNNAPVWQPVITQANAQAYARIVESFLERGFTAAQIAQWDYGVNYETMIGLYYALILGAGYHDHDDEYIAQYKHYYDHLPDAMLVINGTIT
jgi:hypothetical protein